MGRSFVRYLVGVIIVVSLRSEKVRILNDNVNRIVLCPFVIFVCPRFDIARYSDFVSFPAILRNRFSQTAPRYAVKEIRLTLSVRPVIVSVDRY